MGSKGSQTSSVQQNQQYTPAGQGYMTAALNRAGAVADLPFSTPQAPVAGFSDAQNQAFGTIAGAQGMEQPYINQAQQYFSPQGAQQFFNPFANSVTAQMQNIFGQQNVQNTGSLTQAAGGVGADRIAVGQGNLANQQALAAGQTYANLYGQAAQQAQSAAYGTAGLGAQAQNATLQGAQAQLGAGGLQQQLAQAQLNAPYQQQLAAAAFPYQQEQYLAGLTAALAPAMGGTSVGASNSASQFVPSTFGQILGAGTVAGSIFGGIGQQSARGGRIRPFAYGGSADAADYSDEQQDPALTDTEQGSSAEDKPIDIAPKSEIPTTRLPAALPFMPAMNLNPPQQSGGNSGKGGGFGDLVKAGIGLAALFNRGGATPFRNRNKAGTTFEHRFPQGYDDGGSAGGDGGDDGGDGGSVGGFGDSGGFGGFGAEADQAAADAQTFGFASGMSGVSPDTNIGNTFGIAPAQQSGNDNGMGITASPGSFGASGGPGGTAGFGGFGFGANGLGFGIPGVDSNAPSTPGVPAVATNSDPMSIANDPAVVAFNNNTPVTAPPDTKDQEHAPTDQTPATGPIAVHSVSFPVDTTPAAPQTAAAAPTSAPTSAPMSYAPSSVGTVAAPAGVSAPAGVAPSVAETAQTESAPQSATGGGSPIEGIMNKLLGAPGQAQAAAQPAFQANPYVLPIPKGWGGGYGFGGGVKRYADGGSDDDYSPDLLSYDDQAAADQAFDGPAYSLGDVESAYSHLDRMGLRNARAEERQSPFYGPLNASNNEPGVPAQVASPPTAPRAPVSSMHDAIAKLESSGRGVDGPANGYANERYQQFAPFVKQYGFGKDGITNYARQVLQAKPNATFGDFYGGYVTGTGNPATASLNSLLTTKQPGAQGAYKNLVNNSPISPDTPLASLMGDQNGAGQGSLALDGQPQQADNSGAGPTLAPPQKPAAGLANSPALQAIARAMQTAQKAGQQQQQQAGAPPAAQMQLMGAPPASRGSIGAVTPGYDPSNFAAEANAREASKPTVSVPFGAATKPTDTSQAPFGAPAWADPRLFTPAGQNPFGDAQAQETGTDQTPQQPQQQASGDAGQPAPHHGFSFDLNRALNNPLTYMGLAMMAGRPALEGLQASQGAQRLDEEAKFHAQQMAHQNAALAETARHNKADEGKPVPYNAGYDQYGMPAHGLMMRQPDGTWAQAPLPSLQQGQAPPQQQPQGGFRPPGQGAAQTQAASEEEQGAIPANAALVSGGAYDYTHSGPPIEKGMDVPEPQGVADKSATALKRDAETYALTGKLPPVRGTRGKVASDAQDYQNAVKNYGDALLNSRGVTPEQSADLWRGSQGYLRWVLGQQGRSTVAIGNVIRHAEIMRDIAKEWNGGNFRPSNELAAKLSSLFGRTAATNLDAAARIVGPELMKALGVAGAGGIAEREDVKKGFSPGASRDQITGAIDTTERLLGGQLEGRRSEAALAGVDEDHFKRLVGDKPYSILTNLEKGDAKGAGAQGQGTGAPAQDQRAKYIKLREGGMSKEDALKAVGAQ